MIRIVALTLAFGLAPAPPIRAADEPVRLATFNIHHAEGDDGILDLDRVAAVVRGTDLVAFQEVDVRFHTRSRFEDQAAKLARLLGGHLAFGGNLVVGEGRYGVALVSKFPIRSHRNHPLPRVAGREKAEPRGLLEAVVDVRGRAVRVYVTHLAHDSKEDRRLQVDAIRTIVAMGTGPVVLMGDLNFRPDDPQYARLLGPVGGGTAPLFVDAWARVGQGAGPTIGLGGANPGRIDYILASPDLGTGFEAARVDSETKASDHQPVFATLRIPAKPAGSD